MGLKWYQLTAYDMPLFQWIFFFKSKGPLIFKKHKCVFSDSRHFVVAWSVNVEIAANVCCSGALQAVITLIAACVVPLPLL
jgi:hypothetical protein